MLKINVITNYNKWLSYIKKPNYYLKSKIAKLNKKESKFKKIKFFALYYSLEIKKLNF